MKQGLFDSQTESRLYRSLTSTWNAQVSIYPQIPIRKVLGYEWLKKLSLSQRQKDYLLRTEFDYVVCEKATYVPLLAIEFDGIGHGFAKDGEYISKVTPVNDPYRKLKLDAKLDACDLSLFPLFIVSWDEIEPLTDAKDSLTILDGIIGYVLSLRQRHEKVAQGMTDLEAMAEHDPSGNTVSAMLDDIAFEADLQTNPMVRATADLQKRLSGYGIGTKMLKDRPGYIGNRHYLFTHSGSGATDSRHGVVLGVNVYMRELNCGGLLAHALLHAIGEYTLYKTAWQRGYRQLQNSPQGSK